MKKTNKFIISLFARYLILIVFGLSLPLFYKILTPLTLHPTNFILNLFYKSFLFSNYLIINSTLIEIIPACIAGSAYFLLLILNLTTEMKTKQRIYSVSFSLTALLLINILRISILSLMLIKETAYFDITHKIFWYALSILFVVGIWFLTVYLFKIKHIPIYSDIKKLKNIK